MIKSPQTLGESTPSVEAAVERLLAAQRERRQLPGPAVRHELRKGAGLSERQAAAAIGTSKTALRRWEAGATPNGEALERYRRFLKALEEAQ
jgi:DNA-binding transcriptional regulator YiaG